MYTVQKRSYAQGTVAEQLISSVQVDENVDSGNHDFSENENDDNPFEQLALKRVLAVALKSVGCITYVCGRKLVFQDG